ncbi:hypothetical protein [Streptococcus suis]|uniref:hypothetical protein n=1 Tax=Streptococcus suis TaxID=1307 RepID=UPI000CF6ADE6|nr:hypothetical protein [Streptococcus suis]MCK4024434.1 hypothetical protein [Streptococcus suis]MCQ9277583.1 hypothetical protein [Streptococcus suis]HEM3602578.1 hypothetical protein [Streptococcus suis]
MKFRDALQKAIDEKQVSLTNDGIEYKYDTLKVYRGVIKNGTKDIIEKDFLSQIEKGVNLRGRKIDIGVYSCSVFQKTEELEQALKFPKPNKYIIKCEMSSTEQNFGPIRKSQNNSHIDLWLYKEAEPWKYFQYLERD